MRTFGCAFLIALGAALAAAGPARALEQSVVEIAYNDNGRPVTLKGYLGKPEGDGPFPAVVLSHGCSGVEMNHHAWVRRFAAMGYVALIVDSLTTRNIDTLCTDAGFLKLSYQARVYDAYAGAEYLRKQPFVDGARIGVAGWSHGGTVVLKLAVPSQQNTRFLDFMPTPFRSVLAFYPYCGVMDGDMEVPVLILMGDADDWTPVQNCQGMVKVQKAVGRPIDMVVYPGATHAYDAVAVGKGMNYLGHFLKYDAAATDDSAVRAGAFLAQTLK